MRNHDWFQSNFTYVGYESDLRKRKAVASSLACQIDSWHVFRPIHHWNVLANLNQSPRMPHLRLMTSEKTDLVLQRYCYWLSLPRCFTVFYDNNHIRGWGTTRITPPMFREIPLGKVFPPPPMVQVFCRDGKLALSFKCSHVSHSEVTMGWGVLGQC